jgi:hypothetical protein
LPALAIRRCLGCLWRAANLSGVALHIDLAGKTPKCVQLCDHLARRPSFLPAGAVSLFAMPAFYTIKEAIRVGKRLKVRLHDGEHLIEPHVLGRSRSGKTLMRVYQINGPDKGSSGLWKLFDLEQIAAATETGGRFVHPRPGYRTRDPSMNGGVIERL